MLDTRTAAGSVIRSARKDRGWCHKRLLTEILAHPDLGPRYAIGLSTIRAIESGRTRNPRIRAAFAIATVLDRKVSDLWPEL